MGIRSHLLCCDYRLGLISELNEKAYSTIDYFRLFIVATFKSIQIIKKKKKKTLHTSIISESIHFFF